MKKQLLHAICLLAVAGTALGGELAKHETTHVKDGIYMLAAAGGNIGVSVGDDGVFMIDDQYAPYTEQIREEIRKIAGSDTSVDFILNTHYHPDHTGGNENFGELGSLLVAHEKVRERMSSESFRERFLKSGGENLDAALPVVTFNDRVNFHLNGEILRVRHFPQAHTDGDSVVFFDGANVVHTGDLYFQGRYPFIDLDGGGSVSGYLAAVDELIGIIDEDTLLIPGHGELSNRAELVEYRAMLGELRARVKKQFDAGRSLEEVQAMGLSSDLDQRWNWSFISGERMVATMYKDLAR